MFVALAPFYFIAATVLIVLLVISFYRNHFLVSLITGTGMLLAFVSLFNNCQCLPFWAQDMFVLDKLSIISLAIVLISSIIITIFSFFYFNDLADKHEEYYVLLLSALLGTMTMIVARNYVTFFLGLELLSIPLYALIAYRRHHAASVEAGIKYLILAGASTATLVFGLALMYAAAGTMDVYTFALYIGQLSQMPSFVLAGLALFVSAIGFKLALAPFHIWSPDVYQGSPAPVTTFLASVAKIGAFVFVLRLFQEASISQSSPFYITFLVLSVLSMFVGNLLALSQSNVKRILAFSSIAHMGYLLIALLAGGNNGYQAGLFYVIVYVLASLGAFGVIAALSKEDEPQQIDQFKGLYFNKPFLAIVFTISILSLAGIPLTAGFIAKIYLAYAGVLSKMWWMVILLVVNSGIGLYYYLKITTSMFRKSEGTLVQPISIERIPLTLSITLTIIALFTLYFGLLPESILYFLVK